MPRPRPNKLHDELDALLDGRPVELTDELAPMAEAADALRAELAAYQLDPRVADRHLERVLDGSAPVVRLPVRAQPGGWDLRRRLAAVALAAALVLAPATMASAAALPGQAMYPFKRAIEELRIASVQWSSSREAAVRTRVADERLEELDSVVRLQMYTQVPTALKALGKAWLEAKAAVDDARKDGEPVPAVEAKLNRVAVAGSRMVQQVKAAAESGAMPVTAGTRNAIAAAATQSQTVLPPPTRDTTPSDPPPSGTPTPTTQTTQPSQTTATTQPTQPTQTTATTQPTQATPTTEVTTTETTATSEPEATSGSVDEPVEPDAAGAAAGQSPDGGPPPTTVPGP
jgi:Domain of unknown function (DUF5667)